MKTTVKSILGSIPYTADIYDTLRKSRPRTRYNLEQLDELGDKHPRLSLQLVLNLSRIVCTKLANVRSRALATRSP